MKYYLFNPTENITVLCDEYIDANDIMNKEPTCEQVGYISFRDDCDIYLKMAGGEFCGNATMCAAFLTGKKNVKVFVEGTGLVDVKIDKDKGFVSMPRPYATVYKEGYPIVRFKGIDHVIIEDESLNPSKIKQWCEGEAMGFMYLNGNNLKPLVYVKSIDTLFWENSCGSGTSAVGEYRGRRTELIQPCGKVMCYENGILEGHVELIKTVELENNNGKEE